MVKESTGRRDDFCAARHGLDSQSSARPCNYAARVAGHALAGEILVSTVVRDLVASGSDVAFLERGDVELKGIEGPHRLFAVDLASSPTVS